jgi:hypothetical protein
VITRSPAMQALMNTYSGVEVPIIVPVLITLLNQRIKCRQGPNTNRSNCQFWKKSIL